MARTYKKCPWEWNSCFRTPRGKRNALRGNARKRAIPPDGWDDKSYDKQCWQPQRVAEALLRRGWSQKDVIRHLRKKYGLTQRTAYDIVDLESIGSWQWRWPEGTVKVYKEQRDEDGNGC